jgi:hypothetical protein
MGAIPNTHFDVLRSKHKKTLRAYKTTRGAVPVNEQAIYSLSSSTSSVDGGSTVDITLDAINASNGTAVPYTITGISANDITSNNITGNFIVGLTDTITLALTEDALTEGAESLTLSLDNTQESINILINDVSKTPSYILYSDSSVDEGNILTVILQTENIQNGTVIPYTVTGVDQADINGPMTGVFVIRSNNIFPYNVPLYLNDDDVVDSTSIILNEDYIIEGNETLTLTLDNGKASINITINDTVGDNNEPSGVFPYIFPIYFNNETVGDNNGPLSGVTSIDSSIGSTYLGAIAIVYSNAQPVDSSVGSIYLGNVNQLEFRFIDSSIGSTYLGNVNQLEPTSIDSSIGSIYLGNVNRLDPTSIDSSIGSIYLGNVNQLDPTSIDSSVGSTYMGNVNQLEYTFIDSSVGSIYLGNVNQLEYTFIDSSVGSTYMGNVNQLDPTSIDSSVGSIYLGNVNQLEFTFIDSSIGSTYLGSINLGF